MNRNQEEGLSAVRAAEAPGIQRTRMHEEDVAEALAVAVPLPDVLPTTRVRDLNNVVHGILVVGLAVSTFLFLIGLGLDVVLGRMLPESVVPPDEALDRMIQLRPSGFLSMGLITLMLTPLIRVLGSVLVFLGKRDWRYAGVSLLVLLVMAVSIALGRA